ncbi:peptidylprolyl isomerase [Virgibacillus necropolis]|uniref:Peptidyl-prolyl cis-trans isomerase n=1 Tax=Virgibacillus necropolis TaxID=163877 RepID=A0A221MIG5_9BACI|nr:peptidylprolyl isomerase [Virgibacillus necropolis]ASN07420.1 peptidylprolyl isomerase [Virgibacillus necropolis]
MLAKYKVVLLLVSSLLFVIIFAGCGAQSDNETEKKKPEGQTKETSDQDKPAQENPIVTITMENNDEIIIELYPDIAPNTVNNFISLVEKGFYDGLTFHRVIPEFMIQGGDPEGSGTGGPGYSIKGEFSSNGFENDLKHERGVISMARSSDPDSAGSQFFIMVNESPNLNGDYAAFGKVVEGMDVVDAIVSVERDAADKPLEEQRMKTVKVDTKGHDYPEPDVIK